MRFLLLAGFADSIINFRGALIEALLAAGCEVHVAAPNLSQAQAVSDRLQAWGVHTHDIALQRTGMNPLADLYALFALVGLMRRIRPAYVLAYTIKPVVFGSLAAWWCAVPHRYVMITGLGYAFLRDRGWLPRLVRGLYRLALARVDKVFFQNPDDVALFQQQGLLAPSTAYFIVNGSGIDLAQFTPTPLPDEACFLLIARLLGDKGVREYVAAASLVKQDYPLARFRLVGWIDQNPDAIAQVELDAWIEQGVVEFVGRLEDVRPQIEACSVYVLPSYREGTPRTVLEAMAMARPIITTDAPGCRETVVDGENGLLVPVKSVSALAQAMRRLIAAPEERVRMGLASRQRALSKYDVHQVNRDLLREMEIGREARV
jgi:glycosyltransferase involved in cell wall biosynthesis